MLELAEFIARSRPEAEQPAFKQSIADTLKSNQSQEGSEPDINGKRIIISQLLDAVGSVGEEPERGACLLNTVVALIHIPLHRG